VFSENHLGFKKTFMGCQTAVRSGGLTQTEKQHAANYVSGTSLRISDEGCNRHEKRLYELLRSARVLTGARGSGSDLRMQETHARSRAGLPDSLDLQQTQEDQSGNCPRVSGAFCGSPQ
jgi:hypothetical protein